MDAPTHPGRIVVADRVITRVCEQSAAELLGVDRSEVTAQASMVRGGLAVGIASPLPIPALDDTEAVRAAGPVVSRVQDVQAELLDRIAHITGRDVQRVNVRITGAMVERRARVR